MKTKCINGALGVEVCNVDLNIIGDQLRSDIQSLFNKHLVLLFRHQDLTPESQIEFSKLFGSVKSHPLKTRRSVDGHPEVLILENQPGRPGAPNDYWHSDISHSDQPPSATILHSLIVPEGRGDTMLCNMVRAYDQLSDHMRNVITGLEGLHSGMATFERSIAGKSDARPIAPSEIKPPRAHPIVRSPAGTNQKAIFVNPHFTVGIKGLDTEESNWVLDHLYKIATQPENIYRHQWRAGDVLVWDNRRTMHYAVRDYTEEMPRKLHHCTASGEIPV